MCGSEQQSPINLDPLTAVEFPYPTLSFVNYEKPFVQFLVNNGHTSMNASFFKFKFLLLFYVFYSSVVLQIKDHLPDGKLPYLSDGGLPGVYNFHQLHFHWGGDTSRGSEHRISDRT